MKEFQENFPLLEFLMKVSDVFPPKDYTNTQKYSFFITVVLNLSQIMEELLERIFLFFL